MSAVLDPRLKLTEWTDPWWRLNNLYWVIDEDGQEVQFKPNAAQKWLYDNLWWLNIVLKSRQVGFTTFIDLLILDACVFTKNQTAGIIAQGLREASNIFQKKIQFPYSRLPEQIREAVYPLTDSKLELSLSNGSSIMVGTSMRSGTLQWLHVSEFGKISARFPDKAKEIVTGAFNTVHAGNYVFVESTGEGRGGEFYRLTNQAEKRQLAKSKLTAMDFRLHFWPWWKDAKNRLDPEGVPIPADRAKYFDELEKAGIELDAWQRAWYVKKAETQGALMQREYPSNIAESFSGAVEGRIYSVQMAFLRQRGRITRVDHNPSEVVNTFWDLGRNDINAIWFHQYIAGEHRFIDYYQNHLRDLAHYVGEMQKRGYLWGQHFLPHDGANVNLERGESRVDRLAELGLRLESINVVERIPDLGLGIELTRKMLPMAWIDQERCSVGIDCLDEYQWKWDETQAVWMNDPLHNAASNGASAMRCWAEGWNAPIGAYKPKSGRRSFRTA